MDVVNILREFGFPILVCLWFMWRHERMMTTLTERINNLIVINTIIAKTLDVDDHPKELAKDI